MNRARDRESKAIAQVKSSIKIGKYVPREQSVDVLRKSCARDGGIFIGKVSHRNLTMEVVVLDEHVSLERPGLEDDQDGHGRRTRMNLHKFIGGWSVTAGGLALQDDNENLVDLG